MCAHKWKKVSEVVLSSPFEQLVKSGAKVHGNPVLGFFSKKVVIVLVCEKCGEVKEIVESNP